MASGQTNGKIGHKTGQRLAKEIGHGLASGQSAGQEFGQWPTPEEVDKALAMASGQTRPTVATVVLLLLTLGVWALVIIAFTSVVLGL